MAQQIRPGVPQAWQVFMPTLHATPEPALSFAEAEAAAPTRLEPIYHQELKVATRYELLVVTGDPAVEVLQVAAGLGADLIVMATHGRRGACRLVLGSLAERVAREALCPVLTVKPVINRAGTSTTLPSEKGYNGALAGGQPNRVNRSSTLFLISAWCCIESELSFTKPKSHGHRSLASAGVGRVNHLERAGWRATA